MVGPANVMLDCLLCPLDAEGLYVKVVAGVASAISATPYICAQHHSSIVASACYMSRAILLRC